MKFTAAGEVTVEADVLGPAPSGRVRVLFMVSDTGSGISDAIIDIVGEPFTQGDSSFTRTQQGAGLGLTISKQLTALMDGTLTIESEPGQGTVVYLMLPLGLPVPTAGREAAIVEAPTPGTAGRVLLVEDDTVNRLAACRLLEKLGCSVVQAANGVEAVAAVDRERFDCVFMDIQMPVMDGLEATRRIRAAGQGDLPVIAMTAYAMSGDRERFLAAGLNAYIAKPVALEDLTKSLSRALSRARAI